MITCVDARLVGVVEMVVAAILRHVSVRVFVWEKGAAMMLHGFHNNWYS